MRAEFSQAEVQSLSYDSLQTAPASKDAEAAKPYKRSPPGTTSDIIGASAPRNEVRSFARHNSRPMTVMSGASTLCLPLLPFPVHVPQGFERFAMITANGCPPPMGPDEVARIILGNRTDEFEKLRGVPGFQLRPVPWETVKQLVAENTTESLGKLGRSPAGQVVYWKFKGEVRASITLDGRPLYRVS